LSSGRKQASSRSMIGGMAHDSAPPRRIIDLDERELAALVGAVLDERLESLGTKPDARLLDRVHLAQALSVSEKTVVRLTAEGMPYVKLVEAKRYELDRCLEWLRARGESSTLRIVKGGKP
jgi:hypothetical protein